MDQHPKRPGSGLPGADDETPLSYDARVLRAFLVGGRLVSFPAQEKKREVILRYLMDRCFAEDRVYPEVEVNERLAEYNEDVAALRRYLVIAGLMTRAGGEYRRAR
jgi:hypothetical protein